jgi:uncharacterized protein (DUF58 family)
MSAASPTPLLTAADQAQLGDLLFVAHRLVEGLYAGRHRSPRRGHSTEFYDYRAYAPGDELRRLDWKVLARTDRLYVRRYRHDAQLDMHLLLDRSASMDFAGLTSAGRPLAESPTASPPVLTKWTCARRIAAALALIAIRQLDRVSLLTYADRAQPLLPAGGSYAHLQQLIHALENAAPAGVTDPQAALASAHAAISAAHHKAGLLVLFSDLLEEPADLLAALHPFIHGRFDIVIFHILTPQELDLRKLAGHHLIDMETRRSLRTFAPAIAPEYRRRMTEHLARLRSSLAAHRIDYRLTLTTEDPIHALRHYVARRAASLIR